MEELLKGRRICWRLTKTHLIWLLKHLKLKFPLHDYTSSQGTKPSLELPLFTLPLTHTHTHTYIFTFFTTQTLRNLHTRNRPIDCTCNVLMIISNYKIPKIEKIFFFDISRMLKKTMHGFTKLINNPRPSTLQNAVAI